MFSFLSLVAYCGGNKCADHSTCSGEMCKCDNGYHGNGTLKCEGIVSIKIFNWQ